MSGKTLGVVAGGDPSTSVVARIQEFERLGIPAAWMTTGGAALDALTVFAAAAVRTERIKLGTCITPTWPRHPIVAVQQVQVLAQLAPGRFRFGVGPSHKPSMEATYGFKFDAPLTNLREYLHIVKTLLREGKVDFDGRHYHAHVSIANPITDVPVMGSALRRAAFELCGAEADGAISWVCPGFYLRDVAIPALQAGAAKAGRPVPPLVAHAPVCVHDNANEVRAAAREQLAGYPRSPFYASMFTNAGYPEAQEGVWSDAMIDAVVLSGAEAQVADRLRQLLSWGATEIIVSPVTAGPDSQSSLRRTLNLVAEVAKTV